jgi:transposase-like protein
MAFEIVKAMQADGLDWDEGYRPLGRQALEAIIEAQMAAAVERYLQQLEADDAPDRRNGTYRRHLLTELGDIELAVPRTRRYSPVEVIRAYARRTREIDRVILAGFVLGLSTRKVGETLLALLGRAVSATTVSQVAKTLDAAVAAFHRRPLANRYQALMLDGVVLARKTGAGALSVRSWWLWGCGLTARRRSSIFVWPARKALLNGRASSPIFIGAGSPAKAST